MPGNSVLRWDLPVTVQLAIGMTFSGPSPCANMTLGAKAVTGGDGSLLSADFPVGRYGLAVKAGQDHWIRLREGLGAGDGQVPLNEGQATAVGTLGVTK